MAPERSRVELEALIEARRAEWGPKVERYNYLLERAARVELELQQLRPSINEYANANFDLDWEYFRRLQLDGVLPSLPQVVVPANSNHKNDGDDDLPEEMEDDGRHESEFEVGSKGQENR